jgi:hypothetical protein
VSPAVEEEITTPIFRETGSWEAIDAEDPGHVIPGLERAIDEENAVAPPAAPIHASPSAPPPALVPAIENQKSNIEHTNPSPMLRAFDLESRLDRAAQWQAVERSIWDLSPRSALLDARPPMSWASDTCIAIDAQGRVNVWTLYRDGASWYALREWANEHRNLLALTRRDLVVDKNAEVAVHIVLPLEEGEEAAAGAEQRESVVGVLLRAPTKNLHLYRLRIVQWNARRGMLVVPIA